MLFYNATFRSIDTSYPNIYSDDKATRRAARALVVQGLNRLSGVTIPQQYFDRFPNLKRIVGLANDFYNENFEYKINPDRAGEIAHPVILNQQAQIAPALPNPNPGYVVMMAHAVPLTPGNDLSAIAAQIQLLRDESFGSTKVYSNQLVDACMRIVVAANYCTSISSKVNQLALSKLGLYHSLSTGYVSVTAFAWRPIIQRKNDKSNPVYNQRTSLNAKRLYRCLSEVYPSKAASVFQKFMADKVIPFQYIREFAKNSSEFLAHLTFLQQVRPPEGHLFGVIWDDDADSLRNPKSVGVFSHYNRIVRANPKVQVMTTGYFMKDHRAEVEIKSRADLYARRAIAHTTPNAVYFPDPNTVIRIEGILTKTLARNFFVRKGNEKGKNLETLGYLENFNLIKGDARGKMIFHTEGEIQTGSRASIRGVSNATHIDAEDFLDHEVLKGFKSFCQSTLNVNFGYATNIARIFPKGAGNGAYRPHIGTIVKCFCPIESAKAITEWHNVYEIYINEFKGYLSRDTSTYNDASKFLFAAQRILKKSNLDCSTEIEIANYLFISLRDYKIAKGALLASPHFDEEALSTIETTSENCGEILFHYLMSLYTEDNFSFDYNNLLEPDIFIDLP